jgi:hypothetical protein
VAKGVRRPTPLRSKDCQFEEISRPRDIEQTISSNLCRPPVPSPDRCQNEGRPVASAHRARRWIQELKRFSARVEKPPISDAPARELARISVRGSVYRILMRFLVVQIGALRRDLVSNLRRKSIQDHGRGGEQPSWPEVSAQPEAGARVRLVPLPGVRGTNARSRSACRTRERPPFILRSRRTSRRAGRRRESHLLGPTLPQPHQIAPSNSNSLRRKHSCTT